MKTQWKYEEEEETWDCFTAPAGGRSLAAVAAAARLPAGGPSPGGQQSEGPSEGPVQHCEAAGRDTRRWGRPTTTGWASQRCLKVAHKCLNKGQRSENFSNSLVYDGLLLLRCLILY